MGRASETAPPRKAIFPRLQSMYPRRWRCGTRGRCPPSLDPIRPRYRGGRSGSKTGMTSRRAGRDSFPPRASKGRRQGLDLNLREERFGGEFGEPRARGDHRWWPVRSHGGTCDHGTREGGRRPVELVVLEAKDRVGGALWTHQLDGFTLEGGADSFITNKPWGMDLCRRLGLSDQLIGTDAQHRRSFVVREGRLAPVPEGFVLMVPNRLGPILTTPILSIRGKLRMLMDLVLPRRDDEGDESLASFVKRRMGREVLERLVQPLVGGIYTADPAELSLRATLPQYLAMEREHGSLIRAARHQARKARSGRAERRGGAVRPVRIAGRRHGHAPPDTSRRAPRGDSPDRDRGPADRPARPGLTLAGRTAQRAADRGRRRRPDDRGALLGAADRRVRPRPRLAASRDPLRLVGHRQHRLSSRPGGAPARWFRRRRACDRRPLDPGGLVPEHQVSPPGAGRDGPAPRLPRRCHPARHVRA